MRSEHVGGQVELDRLGHVVGKAVLHPASPRA